MIPTCRKDLKPPYINTHFNINNNYSANSSSFHGIEQDENPIHCCTLISRVASLFFNHHGKIEIPTDFSKRISQSLFHSPFGSPGLVLISKSLNGDNYSAWKRAMILALNSKNKLGFVNGSIKAPSEEIDPEGYATWSRCNDMVHSGSVIYYSTAHEVWEDLVSDSLKAMHLASLKFSEILLVFDKSNSLSLPITQN
ncbi:hypothetical protein AAG906_019105 [Vitis piasezkii]